MPPHEEDQERRQAVVVVVIVLMLKKLVLTLKMVMKVIQGPSIAMPVTSVTSVKPAKQPGRRRPSS